MVVLTFGQSQRMVLWEQFTNTSCGPCATVNPAVQAFWDNNPDKVISISYHVWWPGPNDPMYLANTVENAARTNYYGVNSVPYTSIDGNQYNNNTNVSSCTGVVNNRYNTPSPFDIELSHAFNGNQDSIIVTMKITATEAVTANMVAHIAVIEEIMEYENAPGSNGEKDFHNVMKKMLPDAEGTTLPGTFTTGDEQIITEKWKLANVAEMTQLSVVAFIQNTSTKEVYQAAHSPALPPTPIYTYDIWLEALDGLGMANCSEKLKPIVTLRNNGAENLTSADIIFEVNGTVAYTHSWTGDIPFYTSQTVDIPEFSFTGITDENELVIRVSNPNGHDDENNLNDELSHLFDISPQVTQTVKMKLRTDLAPQETTWELTNFAGEVLYSGGPYTQPETFYEETFQLATNDCYAFTLYDSGNNGLCCGNGTGLCRLMDDGNTNFAIINQFGSRITTEFAIDYNVGIEKVAENTFSIYPNPSTGLFTIHSNVLINEVITYELINSAGVILIRGEINRGITNCTLDLSDVAKGLYFLKLRTSRDNTTQKIMLK